MNKDKKLVLIIVLVGSLGLVSIAIQPTLGQDKKLEWEKELITKQHEKQSSLVLDDRDRPHIAYIGGVIRSGSASLVQYTKWNGTGFEIETVEPKDESILEISLALDSNGNPHIAYFNSSANAEDLKYARWDGNKWNIQVVDGADVGTTGRELSLALDSKDHPHISYHSLTDNGSLKYAHYNGNSWNTQIVDGGKNTGSCCNVGFDTSIAIDTKDRPHISYENFTGLSLKYAKLDQNGWDIQTVEDRPDDGSKGSVGQYSSIALDNNGNPHISYLQFSTDTAKHNLKYANFNGNSWSIETVDSKGEVGQYSSIALDNNGNPHIAYFNGSGTTSLKYTSLDSSKNQWNIETVLQRNFKEGRCCLSRGKHTSLALDSKNKPHITYHNQTLASLEYVRRPTPLEPPRNLQATSGDGYVNLSWDPPSDVDENPIDYQLYRDNNLIATLAGSLLSYNDTTVQNGNTYNYSIKARNNIGVSDFSNNVTATPTPLEPPRNLQATSGDGYVNLSWDPPTNLGGYSITYRLYRDNSLIVTLAGSLTSYNDTTVQNGNTYNYSLKAINLTEQRLFESDFSNNVTVTPQKQTQSVVDLYSGNDGSISDGEMGTAITCYITDTGCLGDGLSDSEMGTLITQYILQS